MRRPVHQQRRGAALAGCRTGARPSGGRRGFGSIFECRVCVVTLQFNRSGSHSHRLNPLVRFDHGLGDGALHLAVVAQGGVEFALAFAVHVRELEHGSVVGVGAGNERVLNAGLLADSRADAQQRGFGGRAAEVEAHNREFLPAGVDDECIGVQRVECALGKGVVTVAIAPHRDWLTRRDLAPRRPRLEGLRRQGGREEKEAPEFQHRFCSQCTANEQDPAGTLSGSAKSRPKAAF
jgi:hypothetical protein